MILTTSIPRPAWRWAAVAVAILVLAQPGAYPRAYGAAPPGPAGGGPVSVRFSSIQLENPGTSAQDYEFAAAAGSSAGLAVVRLHWDFGDGSAIDVAYCCRSTVSAVQRHQYGGSGRSYTVTLAAYDAGGGVGWATATVNWPYTGGVQIWGVGGGAVYGAVYGLNCEDGLVPLAATITATGAGTTVTAASGANGSFRVLLGPGEYNVTAAAPGYVPQSSAVYVAAGSASTINFDLERQTASACGQAFDFAISMSPATLNTTASVTSTGNITLRLTGSAPSPVALTASGMPAGVGEVRISPKACTPDCTANVTVSVYQEAPDGTYPITITGTGDGLVRSAAYTVVVTRVIGVQNAVEIDGMNVVDSAPCVIGNHCFSIQQNIAVHLPGSTSEFDFWAQNVIYVTFLKSEWEASANFVIFSTDGTTAIACSAGVPPGCLVNPVTPIAPAFWPNSFTLTSEITGSKLVMTNNFGSFSFPPYPLPSGSSIIPTPPPNCGGICSVNPELALVGDFKSHNATFGPGTRGRAYALLELSSGAWQPADTHTLLTPANAETLEGASGLLWSTPSPNSYIATFTYLPGARYKGISFWV